MNDKLFREKSINRVSSPEQLNDRIRVANPGVWMVLLGIILILIGIYVWGIFGRLDTLLPVGAVTADSRTVCYVSEDEIEKIAEGMAVRAGENECTVEEISLQPVQVDSEFPEYLCHVGGLAKGEWVYEVVLDDVCGEPGSIFRADIVVESVAPLRFIVN